MRHFVGSQSDIDQYMAVRRKHIFEKTKYLRFEKKHDPGTISLLIADSIGKHAALREV